MTPNWVGQEELVTPSWVGQEELVGSGASVTARSVTGMLPSLMDAATVSVSVTPRDETDSSTEDSSPVFELRDVNVFYGKAHAVRDVSIDLTHNRITALIGPSGCGKSTLLRCLNRTNDLIPGARVEGVITYHGLNILADTIDVIELRRRIGMVFQKPNPFPKSIFDNVAFGPKVTGMKLVGRSGMADWVEECLRKAALWDEVKDKLKESGLSLSGGQQQRLCIARAIAVKPDVILMDEPCSSLDPIATARIEELMVELRAEFTIVIVTHNMQQAARVSDRTAFFTAEVQPDGSRQGVLVEEGPTYQLFTTPRERRTEEYITGRFG